MNKLINLIGIIVLCGILIKLSFVFFFLFDELDNGKSAELEVERQKLIDKEGDDQKRTYFCLPFKFVA